MTQKLPLQLISQLRGRRRRGAAAAAGPRRGGCGGPGTGPGAAGCAAAPRPTAGAPRRAPPPPCNPPAAPPRSRQGSSPDERRCLSRVRARGRGYRCAAMLVGSVSPLASASSSPDGRIYLCKLTREPRVGCADARAFYFTPTGLLQLVQCRSERRPYPVRVPRCYGTDLCPFGATLHTHPSKVLLVYGVLRNRR